MFNRIENRSRRRALRGCRESRFRRHGVMVSRAALALTTITGACYRYVSHHYGAPAPIY